MLNELFAVWYEQEDHRRHPVGLYSTWKDVTERVEAVAKRNGIELPDSWTFPAHGHARVFHRGPFHVQRV